MSKYTEKDLHKEAKAAVHSRYKAKGQRTRYLGFDLVLNTCCHHGGVTASLVGKGSYRINGGEPVPFTVGIAI